MMGLTDMKDMTVIMGIIVKGSGHTYMMNNADWPELHGLTDSAERLPCCTVDANASVNYACPRNNRTPFMTFSLIISRRW